MKILDRLLGRRQPSSRDIARERLQLVLAYDQVDISTPLLETLKEELIGTISRHVDIDTAGVEVTLTRRGRRSRLMADIPLLSSRASSGSRRGHS